MPDAVLEPGSFRDRSARVFYHHGEVFRALSARALEQWEALSATEFHARFVAQGRMIRSERVDLDMALPPGAVGWAAALRHEAVPFVSYPYEWSFGMLQDAALLQLDLLIAALDEGLTLKDASAYNVQWRGTVPVFVDVASFEKWTPGEPWMGYRQFCQLFLYPLLLVAYRDVPFHPWLRGSLEGVDAESCQKVLGVRTLLRPGVATHVYLQSRAQAACADTMRDVRAELRAAGFNTRLIKSNARSLRKLVAGLRWRRRPSTWSEYARDHHYNDTDLATKTNFVRAAAASRPHHLAWDLGCNTGTFSRVAANHARQVVAIDGDHLAVERLYQALKAERNATILPLVVNLADPSPDLGWRLLERKQLTARGRPDLVLCLALVHHLVIGANIPLSEFLDWLAGLGADIVIEFVTREDPMVRSLLRNRDDQYADYRLDVFERELAARCAVVRRQPLACETRVLYWARPRNAC
ncbi:MAG: methyltransferase [Acidobacteria bacterium]|nr:MAG: methyltransferase [Acidobacteriota bacterium]